MKPFYKSKTILFNFLVFLAGILALVSENIELNEAYVSWLTVVIGILNIILRMITEKGIDSLFSEEENEE